MKNCDLHTHSCYSDGRDSVKELIVKASRAGIEYLALTDHDSVSGVEEAIREGRKYRVQVIPGIELNAKEAEVLGYFVDIQDKRLNKELRRIKGRTDRKMSGWCDDLEEKGYDISYEQLKREFPLSRNNINVAHALRFLVGKGYGESFKEVVKRIRADGIKRRRIYEIPITRAIGIIKNAGGVPVMAHPWAEESSRELLKDANFRKLVKAGLKGIELDNGDRDGRRNREIVGRIKYLAEKYELILTSGSDYHGIGKAGVSITHTLGTHNCDERVVEQLKDYSLKHY